MQKRNRLFRHLSSRVQVYKYSSWITESFSVDYFPDKIIVYGKKMHDNFYTVELKMITQTQQNG